MQQQPRFTDLERAKLETCAARRQMFQAQRLAIALADQDNDEAEKAIVAAAAERTDAEDRERSAVEANPIPAAA